MPPGARCLVPTLAAAVSLVRPECEAGEVLWVEVSATLECGRGGVWIAEIGPGSDTAEFEAVRRVLAG
jgi:hypothetical protein